MRKKPDFKYLLAASVALITFAVYLPALQNAFVNWDDDVYILDNIHIRSLDLNLIKWSFFNFYAAYWHPLTWMSHALDYALWGLNPRGHHLTNIVLHAINAFITVILIIGLLDALKARTIKTEDSGFLNERTILITAGTTGILFGIHPVHVESVAWVAERKDLLCALFYLLSILIYTKYAGSRVSEGNETAESGMRIAFTNKNYLLTSGLFILALLSKPMAVTLPVVLLILDWYPFNRIKNYKSFLSALLEKLPFIALSSMSSILILLAQGKGGAIASTQWVPFSTRLLVAAKSIVTYLWKMIWPQDISPLYPYPSNVSLLSLEFLAASALVVGITSACFIIIKKQKLWPAVWGYYIVTLVPVLGFVQVGPQSMADRFTYLPSLGPFLIMGLGAAWIAQKGARVKKRRAIVKTVSVGAALLLVVSMAYLTVNQIGIWKNGITLWNYIIETKQVRTHYAYNNRGVIFEKTGQLDKAAEDYRMAIYLDPLFDEQAYFNLGVISYKTGLYDQAIYYYTKAITINAGNENAYHNRGVVYSCRGQLDRALDDFNKAIELNQGFAIAYFNRGNILDKIGRKDLAIGDYKKACDLGYKEGCSVFHK